MPKENDYYEKPFKSKQGVYNGTNSRRSPSPDGERNTGKIWIPSTPTTSFPLNEKPGRNLTPDLVALCQDGRNIRQAGNNDYSSSTQPTYNNSNQSCDAKNANNCVKLNFLNLLKPKKCKISNHSSSCCPFGQGGIPFPICSWFASPKYYYTCSKSSKPNCYGSRCWYYENKKIVAVEEGGTPETTSEQDQNGQQEQEPGVRRRLSSNTLHGVKSVDDLRAWSICGEDQRRYFLEQMMELGKKRSTLGGDEGQLELYDDDDPEAPSDASAMERKYEQLLRQKDEEIQRLKDIIRELEGRPVRPAPSSTRSAPSESKTKLSAPSSKSKTLIFEDEVDSGDTNEESASIKGQPSITSAASYGGQASESLSEINVPTSGASSKTPTRQASETKSGQRSGTASGTTIQDTSDSAAEESKPVSQKGSDVGSQDISESVAEESEPVSPKVLVVEKESDIGSQDVGESVAEESKPVSQKESEIESQDVAESVAGESQPVSQKGSDIGSQDVAESVAGESQPVSQKGSDIGSQDVGESVAEESKPVSQKVSEIESQDASESVAGESQPVSQKESEIIDSQDVSESVAGESQPVSQKESEIIDSQEVSESIAEESKPVSQKESETESQEVAESVAGESQPVSQKESETKSQDISESIAEESKPVSQKESEIESQDVGESVAGESQPVSQKESETESQDISESVAEESKPVSQKESDIESQEVGESVADESEPKVYVVENEDEPGLESNLATPKASSIFGQASQESILPTAPSSGTMPQEGSETVSVDSGAISIKGSDIGTGDDEVGEPKDAEAQYETEPEGSAADILATDSTEESVFGDTPSKLDQDNMLDGIIPLQSNESLCKELLFIVPSTEGVSISQTVSVAPTIGKVASVPATAPQPSTRRQSMSLAEIGGYEERRIKPFTCSCDETTPTHRLLRPPQSSRSAPPTAVQEEQEDMSVILANLDLSQSTLRNPYDIKVVATNNKIRKIQGSRVVEELNPETLVAEYELLKEKVEAQRLKIVGLETALYMGVGAGQPNGMMYRGPNDDERNQIALLHQQVTSLEAALAQRENLATQYYSMLEAAARERNVYREEIRRNQVMLREYDHELTQLQQRVRDLESGIDQQRQSVLFQQQQQQQLQQQQQRQYSNYPNYYPGGGSGAERGDHVVCMRRQ